MLTCFFETIGWPSFLETSSKQQFVAKVHDIKNEIMKEMLSSGEISLRCAKS